jgi:hypothetical protein
VLARSAAFVDIAWTRLLPVAALAFALAAPAQAHGLSRGLSRAGLALEHAVSGLTPATATCPAGVPVQTLTVVNEANVSASALAKVKNAVTVQSLQLRAAWGTPCVQFSSSGWRVYLQTGYEPESTGSYTMQIGGDHFGAGVHGPYWEGSPYALVLTGAASYESWSYAFSHEILEALVDPGDNTYWTWPGDGVRQLLEVCDPVENYTYTLDSVTVEDFTLPAAWSGSSGPYDEAGRLTAPLGTGYTLGL